MVVNKVRFKVKLFFSFVRFTMKEIDSQKSFLKNLENEGKLAEYLEKEPNFMYSLISDPRMSEDIVSTTVSDLFAAGIDTVRIINSLNQSLQILEFDYSFYKTTNNLRSYYCVMLSSLLSFLDIWCSSSNLSLSKSVQIVIVRTKHVLDVWPITVLLVNKSIGVVLLREALE